MALEQVCILGRGHTLLLTLGPPTSADGAGLCPRGAICIALQAPATIWKNRGTRAVPDWRAVGTPDVSGPT